MYIELKKSINNMLKDNSKSNQMLLFFFSYYKYDVILSLKKVRNKNQMLV